MSANLLKENHFAGSVGPSLKIYSHLQAHARYQDVVLAGVGIQGQEGIGEDLRRGGTVGQRKGLHKTQMRETAETNAMG